MRRDAEQRSTQKSKPHEGVKSGREKDIVNAGLVNYSVVTLLARFLGWSQLYPLRTVR